jgi:uncharacterized membrane protein YciS (DUF1049 family)
MRDLLRTSRKVLVILAAIVWVIGGVMLLRSGLELISQARELDPSANWHWLVIGLGSGLGFIQALTIFSKSCQRNIQRIHQLEDPHLWQFFRPGFFLALAGMISTGVLLDRLAQGRYCFSLLVAGLDIALTISLLGSSYVFLRARRPKSSIEE